MTEFTKGGLHLRYTERGNGVPLIFLHGLGGSHLQVLNTLDSTTGIRLIIPEMQGHGESEVDWGNYGFASLADDVVALADHIGINTFFLGGISLGAAVSVNFALRYKSRLRGLALVRPAWIDQPMQPAIRHLYSICAQYLERSDREGFEKTPEYQSVKAISAYTSGALMAYFSDSVSIRHASKFRILPASAPFSLSDLDDLNGVQVEVIACRNDLIHPFEYAEYYRDRILTSRMHEIPDKDSDPDGHKIALNKHLTDFIHSETAV